MNSECQKQIKDKIFDMIRMCTIEKNDENNRY